MPVTEIESHRPDLKNLRNEPEKVPEHQQLAIVELGVVPPVPAVVPPQVTNPSRALPVLLDDDTYEEEESFCVSSSPPKVDHRNFAPPNAPFPIELVPGKHRAVVNNPYNGTTRSVSYRPFPSRGLPTPRLINSYLRPNAIYIGEQQLSSSKYHIKVEFKTIDLVNSLVTGFLQINGLTDDNPVITTCFRGEIINNPINTYKCHKSSLVKKFSFRTENKQWGSYFENDLDHWRKLTGSYDLNDAQLKKKLSNIQNGKESTNLIYMRWKEEFLLPDSRIKQIANASFEGFYYIVLNIGGGSTSESPHQNGTFSSSIIPGSISGLYYHKTNDKFQSLSLRYVKSQNYSNTFEFA